MNTNISEFMQRFFFSIFLLAEMFQRCIVYVRVVSCRRRWGLFKTHFCVQKQWEWIWIQRCVCLMSRGVFKVELGCFKVLHILFDFITVSSSYISSFSVLLFPESAEKKRLWRSNAARRGTVISGVLLPPVLLGRSSRKSVRCGVWLCVR